MSVIATIEVPTEEFTLGETLAANPDVQITLQRVVPLGSTFIPYLWVEDDTVGSIERTLRSEGDIESVSVLDRMNGEALVRIEWGEDLDGLLDVMVATGATILEGTGSGDSWNFQLRFDDSASITEFHHQCAEREIALDVQSVHNPGIPRVDESDRDLTDTQRETLQVALEKGYFDVPRRTNLVELAAEMGVSDTAVSQRIRRGLARLLVQTLSEPSR